MSMISWTRPRIAWIVLAMLLPVAVALQQRVQARQQMRHDLMDLLGQHRKLVSGQFFNLQNQFTPGFKARHPWQNAPVFRQGQIFKTHMATHLAVNGEGCFGVRRGDTTLYTRDGRFEFSEGRLCDSEGRALLGYPVDSDKLIEVQLSLDPATKLYCGRYVGFHFDETGTLFGEERMVDPVTGQVATSSTPLFQVALFHLERPELLQSPNLLTSQRVQAGRAGEGDLGQVCPGSLELSNVDFAQHGLLLHWLKTAGTWCRASLPPSPIQDELCQRLNWDHQFRRHCLQELQGDLLPGYRSTDVLNSMKVIQEQGLLLPTHSPFDLALDGEGYFRHGDGSWSRSLDLSQDQPLGKRTLEGPEEVVCIPSQATRIEVRSNGEVRWMLSDREVVGFYLCLGKAEDVKLLAGGRVRPRGSTCLGLAGEKGLARVVQGSLEMSNQDSYQRRILGAALMQWAGLPLLPEEFPGRGAAQTTSLPPKLNPEIPSHSPLPVSGLLSK